MQLNVLHGQVQTNLTKTVSHITKESNGVSQPFHFNEYVEDYSRRIIPDRNKMLSLIKIHKKGYESAPCSRLAKVCCRYVIEETEITTHLDRIYQKYV